MTLVLTILAWVILFTVVFTGAYRILRDLYFEKGWVKVSIFAAGISVLFLLSLATLFYL